MRISRRVYQASNVKQEAEIVHQTYDEVRESIWSLALRILAVEIVVGLLGLVFRIPVIWFMPSLGAGVEVILIYSLVYIIFQIMNVGVLIFVILDWYNRVYIFKGKDLYFRWGILSITEKIFQFDNVEKVTIRQNLLGRLLDYGTIVIYNPLIKEDAYLQSIPEPRRYADLIQGVVPKG